MKKTILALFIFTLISGAVSAQNGNKGQRQGLNKNCTAYVDSNKDGVCDNLGTKNCPYPNEQRQGMRNGRGQGMRNGNCQGCNGQRQGMRNGRGQGRNFVDANNNGICDTYEKSQQK